MPFTVVRPSGTGIWIDAAPISPGRPASSNTFGSPLLIVIALPGLGGGAGAGSVRVRDTWSPRPTVPPLMASCGPPEPWVLVNEKNAGESTPETFAFTE